MHHNYGIRGASSSSWRIRGASSSSWSIHCVRTTTVRDCAAVMTALCASVCKHHLFLASEILSFGRVLLLKKWHYKNVNRMNVEAFVLEVMSRKCVMLGNPLYCNLTPPGPPSWTPRKPPPGHPPWASFWSDGYPTIILLSSSDDATIILRSSYDCSTSLGYLQGLLRTSRGLLRTSWGLL